MPRMSFDRKVPLPEQRLRVALAKPVRKAPKNHGTGKRKAALRRKNKSHLKHKLGMAKAARRKFLKAAKAFWKGETDEYPQ